MKKFKFNLQSVLNVKEAIEKQKKTELAEIIGEIALMWEAYHARYAEYLKTQELYNTAKNKQMYPYEMNQYEIYLEQIKEELRLMLVEIEKKEKIKERKKAEMEEAMKERKSIEKLKEKKRETYLEEFQIEETKLMEEILNHKISEDESL